MRHILIAIFALAVAADISGQWKGEFGGQNGTREIVFQFKADGARLTGTVSGLRDKQLNIEDGMLQGEEVSFYVNSEWQGNPVKLLYKGKVSGNEIRFTMSSEGGDWSTNVTARRVS
jgi:hypothetical protein